MEREIKKHIALKKTAKKIPAKTALEFSLIAILSFLIIVPLFSAQLPSLNFKLNAKLNSNLNADYYAVTNSNANTSYDGYDAPSPPIQLNDSRLFSWLRNTGLCPYPSSLDWANCTLVIDSWNITPVSTRTFYLVLMVNPASSGTINISWNPADLGGNYSAVLVDYNNSYDYSANASAPIDMKTNSFYSVSSSSFSYRYFLLNITLLPYCGDGVCSSEAGETYSNCPIDGCPRPGRECDSDEDCDVGEECDKDGNCITCTQTCSTKGYECGNYVFCRKEVNCGSCAAGKICSSGKCITPACISDADCNDNNICTDNICVNNSCKYTFNTASCDDNDLCTINDICSQGICSGVFKCKADEQCINGECKPIVECISDSDCKSGETCIGRNCISLTRCEPSCIPPEQCVNGVCKEIPVLESASGASAGCAPNFVCGAWSECSADYNVENLIYQTSVSGVKTRLCIDKENCLVNFEEKQNCSLQEEIIAENKVWCNQNYTEIKDKKTGKVLARLKLGINGKMIDVDLNVEGKGYCPYCFDGIKNYDEEDVDCGGSCVPCAELEIAKKESFTEKLARMFREYRIGLWLSILVFSLLLILLAWLSNKIKLPLEEEFTKNLLLRFKRWQKAGYDINVLKKDVEVIKKEQERMKSLEHKPKFKLKR